MNENLRTVGFLVYDSATGKPIRYGYCPHRNVSMQGNPTLGTEAMEIPKETIIISDVEFEPVREFLYKQVDDKAASIISPGMKPIYVRKRAEAEAGGGPILATEARELGIDLNDLIETVKQKAAEADALELRVESIRRKVKNAIANASNVGLAHKASLVDWELMLATDGTEA